MLLCILISKNKSRKTILKLYSCWSKMGLIHSFKPEKDIGVIRINIIFLLVLLRFWVNSNMKLTKLSFCKYSLKQELIWTNSNNKRDLKIIEAIALILASSFKYWIVWVLNLKYWNCRNLFSLWTYVNLEAKNSQEYERNFINSSRIIDWWISRNKTLTIILHPRKLNLIILT